MSNPEATKLEWYHEASWSINCVLCDISLPCIWPGGAAAAQCTGRDPPVQSVPRYPGTEVQRAAGMVTEYLDI